MVTANVDIAALKARHPLGDTVEAAGVRLRGRGRVRQGVCPFHDEAEGSFTVYADSERFYCFGCGAGGDVLDFIRRAENLSLPEAIARLDGSPEPAPRAANRPVGPRQPPEAAALPPRDPNLLTAAARFYAGQLRRHPEGRAYLASRGVGPAAAARLGLGYAPGGGLRQALESLGFSEQRLRDSGLFMERGAERFAGMVVVPDLSGGLVGRLGASRPRAAVGGRHGGRLRLDRSRRLGVPCLRRPGHAGRRTGRRCPAWLRPRRPRLRLRRRGPGGDVAELAALPQGRTVFLRLLWLAAGSAR